MKLLKINIFVYTILLSSICFSQVKELTYYEQILKNATKSHVYNGVNYELEFIAYSLLNIYISDVNDSSLTLIKTINFNDCLDTELPGYDYYHKYFIYENKIIICNYNFLRIYYLDSDESKIIDLGDKSLYYTVNSINNNVLIENFENDTTYVNCFDLKKEAFDYRFIKDNKSYMLYATEKYYYFVDNTKSSYPIIKVSKSDFSTDTLLIGRVNSTYESINNLKFFTTTNGLFELNKRDIITKLQSNKEHILKAEYIEGGDSIFYGNTLINGKMNVFRIIYDSITFFETELKREFPITYYYDDKFLVGDIDIVTNEIYYIIDSKTKFLKELDNRNFFYASSIDSFSIFLSGNSNSYLNKLIIYNLNNNHIDTFTIEESNFISDYLNYSNFYNTFRKINNQYYYYYIENSGYTKTYSILEKKEVDFKLNLHNYGIRTNKGSDIINFNHQGKYFSFYNSSGELIIINLSNHEELNINYEYFKAKSTIYNRLNPFFDNDDIYLIEDDSLYLINLISKHKTLIQGGIYSNQINKVNNVLYFYYSLFDISTKTLKTYSSIYNKEVHFIKSTTNYLYFGNGDDIFRTTFNSTQLQRICHKYDFKSFNDFEIILSQSNIKVFYKGDSLLYYPNSNFTYSNTSNCRESGMLLISIIKSNTFEDIHFDFTKMIINILPEHLNQIYSKVAFGFIHDNSNNLKKIIVKNFEENKSDSLISENFKLVTFNNKHIYLTNKKNNFTYKYNTNLGKVDSFILNKKINNLYHSFYSLDNNYNCINNNCQYLNNYTFFKYNQSLYLFDMNKDSLIQLSDCDIFFSGFLYIDDIYLIDSTLYFLGYEPSTGKGTQLYSYSLPEIKTSSIDISNDVKNSINVYPNPTSNILNVDGLKSNQYKIYDIYGRLIIETKNSQIDVSYLIPATYILKCFNSNGNAKTVSFLKI